jgi:phage-related protein
VRDAGDVHVDALAVEGDTLGRQVLALPLPHREAAIGAHDAPPGSAIGDLLGREEASAEARRPGRDISIGPHEALRDLPDRLDDFGVPLVVDAEVLHGAPADGGPRKLGWRNRRAGANPVPPELASNMRRRLRHAWGSGRTQATYYRDEQYVQPVEQFIDALAPRHSAKVEAQLDEHLNGRPAEAPPPEFPITSQIEGELRELRIRFGGTRYRILYQRTGNLMVLLHGFEKNTGSVPPSEVAIAKRRMRDLRERMNAHPRKPPRAIGGDAPSRRRLPPSD